MWGIQGGGPSLRATNISPYFSGRDESFVKHVLTVLKAGAPTYADLYNIIARYVI
jgi:hypothetical protein